MLKTTRSAHSRGIDREGPDLTAMLDIIFMLLVFFILTSGTAFRALDLQLPSSDQPQLHVAKDAKTVVLGIAADHFQLDELKVASLAEVASALTGSYAAGENIHLVIATDKDVPIQRFLDVLAKLKDQDIEVASILTEAQKGAVPSPKRRP